MFRNYLKITFRNLWKNKIFVLINVLGLGAAMACCIVAYLNYDFSRNFDADQAHVDDIYRMDIRRVLDSRPQLYGFSPIPAGPAAAANIGSISEVVRVMPSGANFRIGDDSFSESIIYADPRIFEFFSFDIIAGKPESLGNAKSIFISDELAEKFFRDGNALGQTLTRQTPDGPEDHEITGIFRSMPLNSTFATWDIITHTDNYLRQEEGLENDWGSWITTFVRVEDPASIPGIIRELDNRYIDIQNKARLDFRITGYYLEPFLGMAERAEASEVYGHWFNQALPAAAVVVPGVMAILILLIACFNFTNTSMAIAGKRLKEIGLRKVMGGLRKQLIIQFMLENFFLCLFSLLIALIIAWFLVPAYSAMWPFLDISLDFSENINFYFFLLFVLFFTGLLAGSYPAFYVSKFQPAAILRSNLKYGGTSVFTNILLGAQFTISLIAIIFGILFYQNARYQESLDMGFDATGTISLQFPGPDEYQVYKNAIENEPMILSLAGSEHQMDRFYRNDPVISGGQQFDTDIFHVGDGYFSTMGFQLLEGRNFRPDSRTDMEESVIVSEKLVEQFGWEEPIGQRIVWMDSVQLFVIGVMKDVYTDGFWDEIKPLMLRYIPEEDYQFMTVKYEARETMAVGEYLEDTWRELYPDQGYTGQFQDQEITDAATVNNNILVMFTSLGAIATFLSVMGLFSLVSLTILKRMKEIGVRKVLGATVTNIVTLINKKYLIILGISSLLAAAGSYPMANGLMGSIWKHHITPGFTAFGLASGIIILIAMMTVGLKVFRAATANPTETIRME